MRVGNFGLTALDDFVEEFDDSAIVDTDHMIVVLIGRQLEHRMPTLEIVPDHQTGSLKLGEHAIDSRQTHIFTMLEQRTVDILGTHMVLAAINGLQHLQNLDPGQGDFQADLTQFMVFRRHDVPAPLFARSFQVRYDCRPGHDYCSDSLMQKFLWLFIAMGLAACSEFPGVYRIDIEQGNIVTQEELKALKPGLTKRQVKFVLGTPLIEGTFDPNRWTYLYSMQRGGEDRKQKSLTLLFGKDERLLSWSGDTQDAQADDQ